MQHLSILIRRLLAALLLAALLVAHTNAANADDKTTVIDWSKSSVQDTDKSCGKFTFDNMKDHQVYSFLVRGTASGVCIFHADALIFRYPSNYGPVTADTRTFFGFARFGSGVPARRKVGRPDAYNRTACLCLAGVGSGSVSRSEQLAALTQDSGLGRETLAKSERGRGADYGWCGIQNNVPGHTAVAQGPRL